METRGTVAVNTTCAVVCRPGEHLLSCGHLTLTSLQPSKAQSKCAPNCMGYPVAPPSPPPSSLKPEPKRKHTYPKPTPLFFCQTCQEITLTTTCNVFPPPSRYFGSAAPFNEALKDLAKTKAKVLGMRLCEPARAGKFRFDRFDDHLTWIEGIETTLGVWDVWDKTEALGKAVQQIEQMKLDYTAKAD
ncbi:hypothetical protein BDV95DRAFT_666008 [Massariosphaeria phaeospora]|uniref:Uncharacterized protein n=1 Tax=Massariosphaeria phaeospora TaxID=100035 RepID=A0A7C8MIC0_9PLEO|nr:hypothetical protein BDV95DRAFT_666008 [Massariosphaeria phaeospora]